MHHIPMILQLFPGLAENPSILAYAAVGVIGTGVLLLFMLAPRRQHRHSHRQ